MSDVATALAFLARREARTVMSAARWAHLLSFGMGWMNPGEARAFVQRGVQGGLLAPEGDGLRLVIDVGAVQVPRGFRPAPAAPAGAPAAGGGPAGAQDAPSAAGDGTPDPFLAWVARLATHHGVTREQVLGRVAMVQERMGGFLDAATAVLWLARDAGMDVAADAVRAERALGGRG